MTNEWEQALLEAWWREAAQSDQKVPPPDARTKVATPEIIQRALNALSNSTFFANVFKRALIFDLKQVYLYFHDAAIRSEARARVARVVGEDTRVLVGHSLGTVVAYEALCAHPDWRITTLVTLGSPLGIHNLIFEQLQH